MTDIKQEILKDFDKKWNRKCKRCNKQFEVDKYHLSQLYCSDCRYIKDKERYREYRRSILGCKPRKVNSLKKI